MNPSVEQTIINQALVGHTDNPIDLINVLQLLDDQFHNDAQHNLDCSDEQYDYLKKLAERLVPSHHYFTGIGSSVRGGKVKLPYSMPSLNQVEVCQVEHHVNTNDLGDEECVLTDKHDGTSLMIIYNESGDIQICYSRGDGTEGADVTRHVRKMVKCPSNVGVKLDVRCEVQLTEEDFEFLKTKVLSRSGKPYKNSRNMVAGIMNAKDNPDIVYEYLHVVAYTVLNGPTELMNADKDQQLEWLWDRGFTIPTFQKTTFKSLNDDYLSSYLSVRREKSPFCLDGLVIDVNDSTLRATMDAGVGSSNPKSSFKYKVADATNQHIATVSHVEWNISKDGYLKPTVVLYPFELMGVTIMHATGFNAKFIRDNKIGPGAAVRITRSGDVIPYILETVVGTEPDLPATEYVWTDTDVDIMLADPNSNPEVKLQQLVYFSDAMKLPKLREGNIKQLVEAGTITDIEDLLKLSMADCVSVLGAIGVDVYHGLVERLSEVELHDLMGAVPFFGRGVGSRTMKALIKQLGSDYKSWTEEKIITCDDFDVKTAERVLNGIQAFGEFQEKIKDVIQYTTRTVRQDAPLANQKICMTGFRDAEMGRVIEDLGGEVQSGVSAKTTILVCTDINSNSGKAKKARDITAAGKGNIEIIHVDDFRQKLSDIRSGSLT